MRSRFPGRLLIAALAVVNLIRRPFGRAKPASPRRVLVLHHLLLGDTIMLTPLLKKLRERYPLAELVMTCPTAFAGLYQKRPFGVEALPFDERDLRSIFGLMRRAGFDLAIIPAENRLSILSRALDARWVVAFGGDRPAYKSWLVDELRDFPEKPAAWGDLAALLVDGPAPQPYAPGDWPAPEFEPFALPAGDYCVLHVGASTPLKLWEAQKWKRVVDHMEARGLSVVFSAGAREARIVDEIDPAGRHPRFAGNLDLAQLWQLIARARLVVCPDTGIAHLARLAGAPVVVIFGGGSSFLFGGGEFWRNAVERKVTIPGFACRDENILFRRKLGWTNTCARTLGQCSSPRCMQAIGVETVVDAAAGLLDRDVRS
ncbi:MAG TPA: glycosyltransferase family 9 protein [Burkholderiales bacterium]|jgi:ADP-heptose:LPS heptosyltransferase